MKMNLKHVGRRYTILNYALQITSWAPPAPNLNKINTIQPICTVDSFHFSSDETVSNL